MGRAPLLVLPQGRGDRIGRVVEVFEVGLFGHPLEIVLGGEAREELLGGEPPREDAMLVRAQRQQDIPDEVRLAEREGALLFRENQVRRVHAEEHTSELQSQSNLVCRLLLEKKKKSTQTARQRMTAFIA